VFGFRSGRTVRTERIKRLFLIVPGKGLRVRDIADITGINDAEVGSILAQLEAKGWLVSYWAEGSYPRTRLYRFR
jgi:DNA-binding IclR family transcriptional regulator